MTSEQPQNGNSLDAGLRCRKTVTPKKFEANRKNAERSTGPRTERGKRNVRFNALTLGLFAKHVVIPVCDGEKAEKDFQALLGELHQEFQPVGSYEEWLVVKVAESMWRLRRATRCESGSVREASLYSDHRSEEDLIRGLLSDISLLNAAEQLRASGKLSENLNRQIAALVEKERRKRIESMKQDTPRMEPMEREFSLNCIENKKALLELLLDGALRTSQCRSEARLDHQALVSEADMDRILRYEERMYRQIDWAMQRLQDLRDRRAPILPERSQITQEQSQ